MSVATKGASLADDDFRGWWDDVFNQRHALVPDIKNSEEWSERLLLCQRRVLGSVGVQGGALKKAIRVMSFAKQRFDSCRTPQQEYCCMVIGIAMLLAYVASDSRKKKEVRDRARRRLLQMPGQILTAGLSATYSDETIRFIRLFDVGDHDPAVTWRQWREFEVRSRLLFLEGHVFTEPEEGKTCLQIAMEQAESADPIYYEDGKVLKLYEKTSTERAQEVADSIHGVTEAMLGRLGVEFTDQKVSMLFTPFDLIRWHKAFLVGENEFSMSNLRRHTREMFSAWRLDVTLGAREMESAARKLSRQEAAYMTTTPRDNRAVWFETLVPGFADDLFDGGFRVLPEMVKIYISALDSTCGIERGLGTLSSLLDAHVGPMDEDGHTIAYLMDMRLGGPCSESDLAIQPRGDVGELGCEAALEPTDITRDFAHLWVTLHGRRFGLYVTKKKPGPRGPRPDTLAAVAKSTAKGMNSLASRGRQTEDTSEEKTLLGLPRRFFIQRDDRRGSANPVWKGKEMKKFNKTTNKKKVQNAMIKQSRSVAKRNGKNPYTVGELDPRRNLRVGSGVRFGLSAAPRVQARTGKIKIADVCKVALERSRRDFGRYAILHTQELTSLPQKLWNTIAFCDMVVADSPWDLDVGALTESRVVIALIIVATGRPVLPVGAWGSTGEPHLSSMVVHFQAACCLEAKTLVMSPALESGCPNLCKTFESVRGFTGSKWKFAVSEAAGSSDVKLSTLENVRRFLKGVRRVQRQHRGLNGRYFPAAKSASV